MNNKNIKIAIWIVVALLLFSVTFTIGGVVFINMENKMMAPYGLYHCIYNNADSNGFPHNPLAVEKITNECICFMEQDWNTTKIWENCE